MIIEIAKKLKSKKSNWQAYNFLKIEHKNEVLEKFGFYSIIENWKETAEIYPCIDNNYYDKDSWKYYDNQFSKYMRKYSHICPNLLKENYQIMEFNKVFNVLEFKEILDEISNEIRKIDDRISFLKNLERRDIFEYIEPSIKNLNLLRNQDNNKELNLFFYDDVVSKLEVPNFLKINYVHKRIHKELNRRFISIFKVKKFDIVKDFISKIIESEQELNTKLELLHKVYIKFKDLKKIPLDLPNITGKTLRDETSLKMSEFQIIDKSNLLHENECLEYLSEIKFLTWLGIKKLSLIQSLEYTFKKNLQDHIENSLQSFMYLKNKLEKEEFSEKIRNNSIYVYSANNEIKNIKKLFINDKKFFEEEKIAKKDNLGLYKYSDYDVKEFLEVLGIKKANPSNIAVSRINRLKKSDLSYSECLKTLTSLFNLQRTYNLDIQPNGGLYIFQKKVDSIYFRTELNEKYIEKDILPIYSEIQFENTIETKKFFKWLGVKSFSDKSLIRVILNSSNSIDIKLKDLNTVYKRNKDIEFPEKSEILLKSQSNITYSSRNLYTKSDFSKFMEKRELISDIYDIYDEEYLKWLGVNEVSNEYKYRVIAKILSEKTRKLNKQERIEAIEILSKIYQEFPNENENGFYFFNEINEIKNTKEMVLNSEITKKYIPEKTIGSKLGLTKEFLEWLDMIEASNLEIIETLLKKEEYLISDIFNIYSKAKGKINKIDKNIVVYVNNRNKEKTELKNLFLKKDITSFYTNKELIDDFDELGISTKENKEKDIEFFFLWLGVNEYIKIEMWNDKERVCFISRIIKQDFKKIFELAKISDLFNVENARYHIKNKFKPYIDFWVLKDYGIKILNPPVDYETDKEKRLLKMLGIEKELNTDKANSLVKSLKSLESLKKIDAKKDVQEIYSCIYKNKIGLNSQLEYLDKKGNFIKQDKLYYLENKLLLKSIVKKYKFIDLPFEYDKILIKKLFQINFLPDYEYQIQSFKDSINSINYQNLIKKLYPYLLSFYSIEKEQMDIKKIALKLINLKIKFGSFKCYLDDFELEVEHQEVVKSNGVFYIKNDDNIKGKEAIPEILNNIFTNILFISEKSNLRDKIRLAFLYDDYESLESDINETIGKAKLDKMKNLIENLSTNLKTNDEELYGNQNNVETEDIDEDEIIWDSEKTFEEKIKKNKDYDSEGSKSKSNIRNKKNNLDDVKDEYNIGYKKEKRMTRNEDPLNSQNIKTSEPFKPSSNKSWKRNKSDEEIYKAKVEAGRRAEELVKINFPHYKQVSGYAVDGGDDSLGYDFYYVDSTARKHYIEVKNFSHRKMVFTDNEIKTAKKYGIYYHVYLVTDNYILDIKNPFILKTYKV